MVKTVHGKTIELEEDVGVAEGQEVMVTVQTISSTPAHRPGDAFLRTEGALADDTEWDAIMAEIYRARKQDRLPATPDLEDA